MPAITDQLPIIRGVQAESSKINSLKEGKRLFLAPLLLKIYAATGSEIFRAKIRKWIIELEGGPAYSLTIREIFHRFNRVQVGLYTAGPCFMKPKMFHPGTSIGRYSVIPNSLRTFTRNHPMNMKSTHGLFYNSVLGNVKQDLVQFRPLVLGNGVWVGHNVIILPPAEKIGDGAIIKAGSVVSSNVPPYAIVSGFPARIIQYRYKPEVISKLMESQWWLKSPKELDEEGEYFRQLTSN